MKKRNLIFIVLGWLIITIFNYYYMNFFFLAFELIGLILLLFIILVVQIVKMIKERKNLKSSRIQSIIVFTILFLLTFFHSYTNRIIEEADWILFKDLRNEIVKEVKNNILNPNVSWNNWICELPFEFPVVSNGGNDIGIKRNKDNETLTITFYVFRNFFSSPSTRFVYTNDPSEIERIENLINIHPDSNWKIEDNWYRTYSE